MSTASWSSAGYRLCRHGACSKKADPIIIDHRCCGRCQPGRNCRSAASDAYDGPGTFAHDYHEGILDPGMCTVCGEPDEAHRWVYNGFVGERRPRS